MSLSSLFPPAFPFPWPTSGRRLEYLVCLSLVNYEPQVIYFAAPDLTPHSRFSGRYPWAIEDALRKYGNVLRIAPNELVFFTPQAFLGEHSILTGAAVH